MKFRYTIRIAAESQEEALLLPTVHRQHRELVESLITQGALLPAEVLYLLIPGRFQG